MLDLPMLDSVAKGFETYHNGSEDRSERIHRKQHEGRKRDHGVPGTINGRGVDKISPISKRTRTHEKRLRDLAKFRSRIECGNKIGGHFSREKVITGTNDITVRSYLDACLKCESHAERNRRDILRRGGAFGPVKRKVRGNGTHSTVVDVVQDNFFV